MNFGSQSLVISTNFISFDVEWVGIPDDEMTFGNQFYDDDLFTLAELNRLIKGQLIDWDGDEEDEYECDIDSV